MDGIHDLGGMHGFGPVEREENEPPFHAAWEAAVVTMQRSARAARLYNIDEFRHAIERMSPGQYLMSTYFERWLDGITRLMIEKGIVTPAELEARTGFFQARPESPATAALSSPPPLSTVPRESGVETFFRPGTARPRFAVGDRVLTREFHPHGHTRLPRYARGRRGVVHALRGVCPLPDTNAHGQGEQPEPVYSVRFEASEIWSDAAEPNAHVYIDLWERYLRPG